MANPIVIDISHHQPDPIDWQQVRAGGTVGVIHKATEGNGYVDPELFVRARAAMDAGLCWATYHFLRPGDMAGQIQFYLDTIDPRVGERVCLDHEDSGVSLAQLRQAVEILIAHPNNLQVTIYSGHLIEEQLAGQRDDYLAANTSLWTAEYEDRPSEVEWNSATWPKPSLWQYTDSASVSGIDGPVDGNKWNGSEENLVKWFGPAEEPEEKAGVHFSVTTKGNPDIVIEVDNVVVWETE